MENENTEKEQLYFIDKISNEIDYYFSNRKIINLFHFTSASGLKGIIESDSIWATHYNYLNDPNEIKYGIQIIKDVLKQEFHSNKTIKLASDILLTVLGDDLINLRIIESEIYITSLCEKNNLLGQWREYGLRGKGYCLCFSDLENLVIGPHWDYLKEGDSIAPCLSPKPVLYSFEQQRDFIISVFRNTVVELDSGLRESEDLSDDNIWLRVVIEYIKDLIVYIMPYIKKEEFNEEKEWRIVSYPAQNNLKIQFREKNNMLIPYHKLGFYKKSGKDAKSVSSPIKQIIYGNSLENMKVEYSLKSFLNNTNRDQIEIKRSDIELSD